VDALIELQLRGGFIGIVHAMDEADVECVMRHPLPMFETDGDLIEIGKGYPHPRSLGSFPRVLGRYLRERKGAHARAGRAQDDRTGHGLMGAGGSRTGGRGREAIRTTLPTASATSSSTARRKSMAAC
jgi:N-acyl-D-aspartate/D-glutamate deacylase